MKSLQQLILFQVPVISILFSPFVFVGDSLDPDKSYHIDIQVLKFLEEGESMEITAYVKTNDGEYHEVAYFDQYGTFYNVFEIESAKSVSLKSSHPKSEWDYTLYENYED